MLTEVFGRMVVHKNLAEAGKTQEGKRRRQGMWCERRMNPKESRSTIPRRRQRRQCARSNRSVKTVSAEQAMAGQVSLTSFHRMDKCVRVEIRTSLLLPSVQADVHRDSRCQAFQERFVIDTCLFLLPFCAYTPPFSRANVLPPSSMPPPSKIHTPSSILALHRRKRGLLLPL